MATQARLDTVEEALEGLSDRLDAQQQEAQEEVRHLKGALERQEAFMKEGFDRIEALLLRTQGERSSRRELLPVGLSPVERGMPPAAANETLRSGSMREIREGSGISSGQFTQEQRNFAMHDRLDRWGDSGRRPRVAWSRQRWGRRPRTVVVAAANAAAGGLRGKAGRGSGSTMDGWNPWWEWGEVSGGSWEAFPP